MFSAAGTLLFGRNTNSVVNASMGIAQSGYSRRQEREADAFGLRLVRDVYDHTEDSLEFFETVESEHGAGEIRWAAFIRSHPLSSNRLDALRQLQATLKEDD